MAVTSKKKATPRKKAAKKVVAKQRMDEDTREDMLLEREALAVDTDEHRAKKDSSKPRGKDAENLVLKQLKKLGREGKPVDDLSGPLKKLYSVVYRRLIMPLLVELL